MPESIETFIGLTVGVHRADELYADESKQSLLRDKSSV